VVTVTPWGRTAAAYFDGVSGELASWQLHLLHSGRPHPTEQVLPTAAAALRGFPGCQGIHTQQSWKWDSICVSR
jgi:hypothetical protein